MIGKFLVLASSTVGALWFISPLHPDKFAPPPTTVSVSQTNTVFKDWVKLPKAMLCPQWAQMAVDTGWREADLSKLDAIMYAESRCFTTVFNPKDPNGGSYGLMQINGYFCKPSKWHPNGYLQALGALKHCNELFYPRVNLLSARLLWLYSHKEYGNGWLPWQK